MKVWVDRFKKRILEQFEDKLQNEDCMGLKYKT